MPYTDQNNLLWTRSEDLLSITCEDGRVVLGNAEMTDEYLVSVAYRRAREVRRRADRGTRSPSPSPPFKTLLTMFIALLFLTGLLIGFVAGLLVYRKHLDKLKAAEGKGKTILDALKGK